MILHMQGDYFKRVTIDHREHVNYPLSVKFKRGFHLISIPC